MATERTRTPLPAAPPREPSWPAWDWKYRPGFYELEEPEPPEEPPHEGV